MKICDLLMVTKYKNKATKIRWIIVLIFYDDLSFKVIIGEK
jgi:hypothetical protein